MVKYITKFVKEMIQEFFDKIIDVVTLLGGDINDAL